MPNAPAPERRVRSRISVDERRAEILVATRTVVLRLGFAGTRVRDVADELGVSSGLIHYHFASKDDLFAQTLRFAADDDAARWRATVDLGNEPSERFDRAILEYLPSEDDTSWRLWIDAWGEALRNPVLQAISEELDSAWVALLLEIIVDGVQRGAFHCPNPHDSAWRIAALMDGLGLQVVLHRGTVERAQMLEHARVMAAQELGVSRNAFPPPAADP